jgi:hypothetical protein
VIRPRWRALNACYDRCVQRDAVQRWFSGHRAAARRALEVMRQEGPPPPAVAFAQAMELCDLVDVAPPDAVREREDRAARAAWAKLRAWATNPVAPG